MTFTSNKDIEHIARGLINCTLPKAEWTHAAHFAAAVWLLASNTYDPFTEMPDMIRRYNESVGGINSDTEGYHETITLASLRAAQDVLKNGAENTPLFETLNTVLNSDYGQPGWILTYWSQEVLFSVKARREWVAPDRQALPFG